MRLTRHYLFGETLDWINLFSILKIKRAIDVGRFAESFYTGYPTIFLNCNEIGPISIGKAATSYDTIRFVLAHVLQARRKNYLRACEQEKTIPMFPMILVIGIILAAGLFIAGVSKKAIILSVVGAVIGLVLLGLLSTLILVNSPLWSM